MVPAESVDQPSAAALMRRAGLAVRPAIHPRAGSDADAIAAAEKAFQNAKKHAEKACEEAVEEARKKREDAIQQAWQLREETIEQAWNIYSKLSSSVTCLKITFACSIN